MHGGHHRTSSHWRCISVFVLFRGFGTKHLVTRRVCLVEILCRRVPQSTAVRLLLLYVLCSVQAIYSETLTPYISWYPWGCVFFFFSLFCYRFSMCLLMFSNFGWLDISIWLGIGFDIGIWHGLLYFYIKLITFRLNVDNIEGLRKCELIWACVCENRAIDLSHVLILDKMLLVVILKLLSDFDRDR